MGKNEHPFEVVDLDGYQAEIDVEIVDLIKAINQMGWITTMSCQDNADSRVWIQFKTAHHAERFLFCIAANSVYTHNSLALAVLNATTKGYDESPNSFHWNNRWWVDANLRTGLWAHGIDINISIRFPRKHLKLVTNIMTEVLEYRRPKLIR